MSDDLFDIVKWRLKVIAKVVNCYFTPSIKTSPTTTIHVQVALEVDLADHNPALSRICPTPTSLQPSVNNQHPLPQTTVPLDLESRLDSRHFRAI